VSCALALTAEQLALVRGHLFPGDGYEAAAVLLCGRGGGDDHHRLVVNRVVLIPHAQCIREPDRLTWPTDQLVPILDIAEQRGWAIVKVHSHPGGYPRFSPTDDRADRELFSSIHGWVGGGDHASVIMLPDGSLFGRAMHADGSWSPLRAVLVVGHDIAIHAMGGDGIEPTIVAAEQVFGAGTVRRLRHLHVAVIGCSGTGSIMVEQLARLGVGHLVLVDPQQMEDRNRNRVLGSSAADALARRHKVHILADQVARIGFGTSVVPLVSGLEAATAWRAVSGCDITIGCVDALAPRALMTRLGTYYLQPYIDLGVRLVADGHGGITTVCGSVHYVQPGYSPLDVRGVYRPEDLRAEGLARRDPTAYRRQLAEKYIRGATEPSPTVMPVNMLIAAVAMNDLLGRIHPYRTMGNRHSSLMANLGEMEIVPGHHHERDDELFGRIGHGHGRPPLGMPELALTSEAPR
jgi:hypothetical protein